MLHRSTLPLLPALLFISLVTSARGDTLVRIALGDIAAEDWTALGVDLELNLRSDAQHGLRIAVAAVELPAPLGPVAELQLRCEHLTQFAEGWRCDQGAAGVSKSEFGAQALKWRGEYKTDGSGWLEFTGLRIANGVAGVRASLADGRWQAKLNTERLDLRVLARSHRWLGLPRDWKLNGRLSLTSELFGTGVETRKLSGAARVQGLSFSSPDSRYEGAGLNASLSINGEAVSAKWRGTAQAAWDAGQLYLEPLFLETDAAPLQATLRGGWDPRAHALSIARWSLSRSGSLDASGGARVDTRSWTLISASFKLVSEQLARLYDDVLQPFLIGTVGDELKVSGGADLSGEVDGAGLSGLALELRDLDLRDGRQRFLLSGVNGGVYWSRASHTRVSNIDIRQAGVYRVLTRPFKLAFLAAGDDVQLSEPMSIPILRGAVSLDAFLLQGLFSDGLSWRASASLRDLSLQELTKTFDWPPFTGTVTARLPDMTYRDRLFNAGGGLNLSVFGGEIDIIGLRLRDPFGFAPVLEGAARMRALDLDEVTRTFSFGNIKGRLDGDLDDLQLVAWQPNRFALHLYTPAQDRSTRRISQRAVENLTELGSGVPAGLSSALLRIFEDFSYNRIDLNIILNGNLAELNGIARSDGGYYLVKGAGLPRIDVIGRNRRVAWKDLVERLKQIRVEGAEFR